MTVDITISEHKVPTEVGMLFAKSWQAGSSWRAPIILLHDSLGCVSLWRDFPALLAQRTGRSVIAYDRLGFGRSDENPAVLPIDFINKESETGIRSICRYFNINRFVLMGHSVGGGMAVAAAAAWQRECEAAITVSAQAFVEDRTLEGIIKARQDFKDSATFDRLTRYHGDKARWVLDAWIDTWLSPAFSGWTLNPVLPNVKCPLLVVHGDNDEYGTMAHPQRIAELSGAGGRITIIEKCGHNPHREQPEVMLQTVERFLAFSTTPHMQKATR